MEDGGEKGKPGYYVRSYEGLNKGCDNKNPEGDIEIVRSLVDPECLGAVLSL